MQRAYIFNNSRKKFTPLYVLEKQLILLTRLWPFPPCIFHFEAFDRVCDHRILSSEVIDRLFSRAVEPEQ